MAALTSQTQSRLLTLPLELRNQIWAHLLRSIAPAPIWNHNIKPNGKCRRDYIQWPTRPPSASETYIYTSSAAVLTCRQLHTEILDVVTKHPRDFPYHLDVLIPDAVHCYPTWLSLPVPLRFYNDGEDLNIDVDFRIENLDGSSPRCGNLRWGGDGGPGEAQIMLLEVLGHWCVNGPLFTRPLSTSSTALSAPEAPYPIKAKDLRMHFVPWNPFAPCTDRGLEQKLGEKAPKHLGFGIEKEHPQMYHHQNLMYEIHGLAENGLLFGRVEKLSLDVKGAKKGEEDAYTFIVKDRDEGAKRATSAEWAPYGWVPGR